ncbi:hypothetical protein QZH41_012397, partial [Actinostola sp. cb2023]
LTCMMKNRSSSVKYHKISGEDDGYVAAQYADRTYPLLIIGSLMFIPGFYHVRLAYCAWKGYRGYSFDDIPDFD